MKCHAFSSCGYHILELLIPLEQGRVRVYALPGRCQPQDQAFIHMAPCFIAWICWLDMYNIFLASSRIFHTSVSLAPCATWELSHTHSYLEIWMLLL